MPHTLVAGATGYLGRHLAAELSRRGHTVRAVVRERARAERPGKLGSPSLAGIVDEWVVGDVTDPALPRDAVAGVDHVASALGVTTQKADPWTVDYRANLALLHAALDHGAASFAYVNVLGAESCPAQLTRAKSAFASALSVSPLTSQVFNPTGFYSDMMQIMTLARRGIVPVFRRTGRINPIHGADLATAVADRVESGENGTWDLGGPDVLTWEQIATAAFAALGERPRIVTVPSGVLPPALRLTAVFSPSAADIARFATWGMTHEAVGTPTGTRHLADFFASQARALTRAAG